MVPDPDPGPAAAAGPRPAGAAGPGWVANQRLRSGGGPDTDSVVVIGLGNPILSDDAVGFFAVRRAREVLAGEPVCFVEAAVGGLDLVELLSGYRAAVLVDAVVTGKAGPGEVLDLDPSFLEDTTHLGTAGVAHQIDLATAWKLGRRLGFPLPEHVRVLGVEAADVKTFSERLTPAVEASLPRITAAVVAAVREALAAVREGQPAVGRRDGGEARCTNSASWTPSSRR